jgi:predicted ATPase
MARLLGIRIKNFRLLADVSLGQVQYGKGTPLPRLACFIGPNGSGKSTILDAFGFIADALLEGVELACDKSWRGGFEQLRSRGMKGPISFELFFEDDDPDRPIAYNFAVDVIDGVPSVVEESLRQRRQNQTRGKPYYFLKLKKGIGKVWAGDKLGEDLEDKAADTVSLEDQTKLAITTFGNLAQHPRISRLRAYVEGWFLSYFIPDASRRLGPAGPQRFLNRDGSNIGNVLQFLERQHKGEFKAILARMASAVPGIKKITTETSADKRLLVRFDQEGFVDPFYQTAMSDGTMKMLAYAVLLHDPEPRPFVGIEEPENGLYVRLTEQLAMRLMERAQHAQTQFLVTTHSPYFVDPLKPDQVWVCRRNESGFCAVQRASEIPTISELVAEGIPLGSLWYSNHLDDGEPKL